MNPYLNVILWFAGILLLFIVLIIRENRKRKKVLLRKLKRIYGQVPEQEYEASDLERISHYFRRKAQGQKFVIDDITWNDLDMDRMYMLINQTISSPGEDVLYAMLRIPLFDREKIKERDQLVEFFATHEEERLKMQWILSEVGKTRLGSLSDTILALDGAPKVNPALHWGMLTLLLGTLLILLPLSPLHGFLVLFLLSIVNISIYFAGRDRKLIEIYLDCLTSLLRMLSAADHMETVKWPQVQKQMDAISKGKKAFAGLRRLSVFLTSKNADSGDPLQILMEYIRMVFHVDILTYNRVLREVHGKSDRIMEMLENMGELDAAISIASFREILPLKCKPEFQDYDGTPVSVEVEDLYHPLIQEPVANCMNAKGGTLVTGSNASGKSTFLKNMALNSLLAQTMGICTCSSYRAPFLKVMTSMALRDDLSGGESYFIVEIKSLKRILDESQKEEPLLCIVDEVLRGTNTIERIAASSRILKELDRPWVLSFAATHDIELSYILEGVYHNYHFEEEVREKEVVFNYLLQKGRATTRNAIKLLDMLGYEEKIVSDARNAASEFEHTGVWKSMKGGKKQRCW